jgi:perosamine synthetase
VSEPRIPLARPDLTAAEVAAVTEVVRSGHLSMGPKVVEFERQFAAYLGVRHAVAVANGTCGLHLALRAAGVGPGTEVLTTPFTFVATANAVLMAGGRPVFVDIDPETLNLTPGAVRAAIAGEYAFRDGRPVHRHRGAVLQALLPVATFGHPVEMDGLRQVAREWGLAIVHDTCESFGSRYRSGERGGWVSEAQLADVAVYAFYPNKQITTGEGGMVVTDDPAVAARCRMERNQGRAGDGRWNHAGLGFNYRMDELSAALGVVQLRRAEELLARRAQVSAWYDAALADLPEVERPRVAPWARVSWFVYVVRLPAGVDRPAVIAHLAGRGIAAKPYFPAVHLQAYLRTLEYGPGDFPVAEDMASRTLALPFYNAMSREDVAAVAQSLRETVGAQRPAAGDHPAGRSMS